MDKTAIQLDLRSGDIDRCRRHLNGRLRQQILEVSQSGDIGTISQLVADIRSLDFVGAMKPDVPTAEPAPVPTREQHDQEIQKLTAKQSRKDRMDAAKDEAA